MSGFDDATALRADGEGRYRADVHPDWSVAGRTNGGYLLALLARAAVTTAEGDGATATTPVAATASYLSPAPPGPAQVEVTTLRTGRASSAHRVRLSVAGEPRAEALVTLGRLHEGSEPVHDGVPRPQVPPLEACVRLTVDAPGFTVPLMGQVREHLDPACLGWAEGHPSGAGELRGWVELPDRAADPLALLLLVDAVPPATFDLGLGLGGWVPTLQLTGHVRALPAPGALLVRQRARLVQDGLVDETCDLWDARGRLVATGHQLAGVRLPPA